MATHGRRSPHSNPEGSKDAGTTKRFIQKELGGSKKKRRISLEEPNPNSVKKCMILLDVGELLGAVSDMIVECTDGVLSGRGVKSKLKQLNLAAKKLKEACDVIQATVPSLCGLKRVDQACTMIREARSVLRDEAIRSSKWKEKSPAVRIVENFSTIVQSYRKKQLV